MENLQPKVHKKTIVFAWLCLLLGYLFCRAFPAIEHPTGWFLVLTIAILVSFIFATLHRARVSVYAVIVGFLSIALAASGVVTENVLIGLVSFVLSMLLYCYFIYTVFGNRLEEGCSNLMLFDCIKAVVIFPFVSFGKLFSTLWQGKSQDGLRNLVKILAGVVLAFVPTVFVALMLSYDAGFSQMMSNIFSLRFSDLFSHLVSFACGIPVAMYLFGLFFSSKEKKETFSISSKESCQHGFASIKRLPQITAVVAVLPILLLYVAFFISQWQYYLLGFKGVVPETFSVASYAREGFFQLCAVSFVNLLITSGVLLFTRQKEGGKNGLGKVLTTIFCVFTWVLIATAISKLVLYIDTYGLTQKRVYAMWFMILIALVFLVILLGQFIRRFRCVFAAIWISIGCYALLSFCNVNGMVARYNTDRFIEGRLQTVDLQAMDDLGDSAVPSLVRLAKHLEQKEDESYVGLETSLNNLLTTKVTEMNEREETVFSFTFPANQARKALREFK